LKGSNNSSKPPEVIKIGNQELVRSLGSVMKMALLKVKINPIILKAQKRMI